MAEEDIENSQRTEAPTQRRIDEAVKRGQVAYSREVGNFFILLLLTFLIYWILPGSLSKTAMLLSRFLERADDIDLDSGTSRLFTFELIKDFASVMVLPLILGVAVVIFSSFIQNGFVISAEAIIPQLDKISPMRGLKRIFSTRSAIEFIKGIIKISLVGLIAYIAIRPYMNNIENLPGYEVGALMLLLSRMAFHIMIGVCIMMAIIAILDYLYQRYEYLKSLRMTKQEVKEEMKQSEGDPIIKGRLRQIRMERARRRMMSAVPKADVVITNPTHYSVALKYEQGSMRAPIMVAKGADLIALNIRKVAKEHNIPLVENKPLARALYESVNIDDEIPTQHYQAVAEIVAYVYKLKNKRLA